MKIWISKYALSSGIWEVEAHQSSSGSADAVVVKPKDNPHLGNAFDCYFHGKDLEWHDKWEHCMMRCEEMRKKKLESLKKQIAKLEKKEFKCKTNPT